MNDILSRLNPFSDENISTILITVIVIVLLPFLMIGIEKFIIPQLGPDNRFVKFWKKHIIDEDPFHL
jgi:hypothetical protein